MARKINITRINQFLIYILILSFPLGQLTRFSLFRPDINFYLHDLIIFLIIAFNFPKVLNLIINQKIIILFSFYVIFNLFLSLNILSPLEVLISSLYFFRFLSFIFLYYILSQNLYSKTSKYIIIAIVISLLLAFSQYFFLPSFEFLYPFGWDRHFARLSGTWLDPNFTGIIFIMYFFYLQKSKAKLVNFQFIILSFALLLALLLTYSRASYLAFIVSLLYYSIQKRKQKIALIIVLLLLSSLFFLPQKFGEGTKLLRTSTIFARLSNFKEAQFLIRKKPIFGHGFNTLRYVKKNYQLSDEKWQISHSGPGLDNSLMFLLATLGIIGTILYFYLIRKIIGKNLDLCAKTNLIAIFISGIFSLTWFYPWVIIFFTLSQPSQTKKPA